MRPLLGHLVFRHEPCRLTQSFKFLHMINVLETQVEVWENEKCCRNMS